MDRAGIGKLHDTIPLVAGTAERAVLFPSPDLHQRVQRLDTGCIEQWNGTEWAELLCAGEGGGGGTFPQAEYVVVDFSDDLTEERRLQVGAGLTLTDGGADGDITLAITCPNYCGNGSPEGVVTAAVGSWYLQRDAASSTHPLWAKRTGTGNTGWVAYAGHRGTGTQSLAFGDSSSATATNAQSFGQSAAATAADTLAVGRSSAASAADAIAIGDGAVASGTSAVALGKSTTASGTRSEAIGEGSTASATDAKAFGVGATAAATEALALGALATVNTGATQGIAIGSGATVDASAVKGVSVGDGRARNANDIIVGYGNDIGGTLAHANVVMGKSATIGTTADASSPTPSAHGGHVVIGESASSGMGPSAFPNTIIGRDASSVGRAIVAIGQGAQARAANTPVSGQSEGHFGVIIGYNAKGSGGCIVAVGDQADVRGDNTGAVGTHARANDSYTAAYGPNAFAGSLTSDGSGSNSSAFGVSAQALGSNSTALGSSATAKAVVSSAVGTNAYVDTLMEGATALGYGATPVAPRTLMIGGHPDDGSDLITGICFNGATVPAIIVLPNGQIQVNDLNGGTTAVQQPIAADRTLSADERSMQVNATAAARTITLPLASSVPAATHVYVVKVDSSANAVHVQRQGSDTLDFDTLPYDLTAQWKYALFKRTTASNWNTDYFN